MATANTMAAPDLLAHIVDEKAQSGYSRPYAMIPVSKDPSDGFKAISYARLANAVNRAAWWLDLELPKTMDKKEPYAYIGPNDLRYYILFLASMKTERQVSHSPSSSLYPLCNA